MELREFASLIRFLSFKILVFLSLPPNHANSLSYFISYNYLSALSVGPVLTFVKNVRDDD